MATSTKEYVHSRRSGSLRQRCTEMANVEKAQHAPGAQNCASDTADGAARDTWQGTCTTTTPVASTPNPRAKQNASQSSNSLSTVDCRCPLALELQDICKAILQSNAQGARLIQEPQNKSRAHPPPCCHPRHAPGRGSKQRNELV